jgi:hypothetical protein
MQSEETKKKECREHCRILLNVLTHITSTRKKRGGKKEHEK